MGLRTLRLPSTEIKVPGGDSFAVRGLSLTDISILATKHGAALSMLFERYITRSAEGLQPAEMVAVGKTILELAPEAAIEGIALAADEPDAVDVVRKLPFPVQVEALEAMVAHTFASEAEIKKVVETVTRAALGTNRLVDSLRLP
jgi:hypothetical protein